MKSWKKWVGYGIRLIGSTIAVWGLLISATSVHSQDSTQQATIPTAAPMMDSTLMAMVGDWTGSVTVAGQSVYGEVSFSNAVGHQWVEGVVHVWPDKTRKTAPMMEFVMYLRPGATPGIYKVLGMGSDGVGGTGTVRALGGALNWSWSYDNDTKETGVLTHVNPDHMIYKGAYVDKAGNKLMELEQHMIRVKK